MFTAHSSGSLAISLNVTTRMVSILLDLINSVSYKAVVYSTYIISLKKYTTDELINLVSVLPVKPVYTVSHVPANSKRVYGHNPSTGVTKQWNSHTACVRELTDGKFNSSTRKALGKRIDTNETFQGYLIRSTPFK